jgi:acetyl-CoA C-acetyltransferase
MGGKARNGNRTRKGMPMKEVVICEPVRTAVGGYGGMYVDIPATKLAQTVIEGILTRTGVDPEAIDHVIFGQCYPSINLWRNGK